MVTLKQLAKELGVSISTVSKALNDSEEIGEDTRKKVKELAALYNYKPNKVALSLKQNKTKTIGVIIPDILNHFLAKVLFGIEREANLHGYNIITCISNESLQKEKDSLQLLANGSVDGFILSIAEETQTKNEINHFKETISKGLPIVMFDRVAHDVRCDKVIVDDFEATYNATKSLIAEKRRDIVFMSNIDNISVGKLRERGYNKAMLEENLNTHVLRIKKGDDVQQKIKRLYKKYKKIDGVVSADSTSGVVAINMARDFKKKVPKDVSVVGFSSKSVSIHSVPKLTIIRQHAKKIGAKAAQLLIERLNNTAEAKDDYTTKIVKTTLVKSKSTL
ncbi:LacI family DNA-binding transcriptional regulator [Hyunsoonleella pacifica]|uniref:LacI family transcriptional regulator n=1 Tax=Hyunsoonleella pacifica TaxID=1080224 RepID=A0A4Q9FN42_9FLAO|nr:LacI family DNA-binding transcriptional regulator [Hyunsoonleella pacifica]TBN15651.1 LacI family transcriptional regulator [Hyunsoonleella pacifica]GGD21569.1 LacI family transcriptional regulator [Hyunsoonleella pacifica]